MITEPYFHHQDKAQNNTETMKIYAFEIEDWERESLEKLGESHDLTCVTSALTQENCSDFTDAEIISTFIRSDLSGDVIRSLPNLQAIATRSTGFDHIDMDACGEREIRVANVPTYGENTVASHTIGLLLNIAHRISEGVERTRKGDFSHQGLRGFDVRGKTIGVIGASGNIGRHVVRMAKGIGMEVVGQDVKPDEDFAKEENFDFVSMEELCQRSDVVTVHVPYNEKTDKLINEDVFAKMKRGVVFLNTSRGGVVDERALLKALSEDRIAAAGLDVVGAEPVIREEAELLRTVVEDEEKWGDLLAEETLLRLQNVYVTPHNAFNTTEAIQRILDTTVENIEAFLREEPQNVVNSD